MGQECKDHDQGAAMQPSQLPAPAVVNILRKVGMQERLSQCSLVCRGWTAAAASATDSIVAELPASKLPALQHWLRHHGRHVHTLHLTRSHQSHEGQLVLPCAELVHLTCLHVDGFLPDLQLPPGGRKDSSDPAAHTYDNNYSNSSASSSRGRRRNKKRTNNVQSGSSSSSPVQGLLPLPLLLDVAVHNCTLSSSSILMQLTNLSGLTSLSLAYLQINTDDHRSAAAMSRAVGALLQQLPKLAELKLAGMELTPHALSDVSSSLTRLSMACTSCHEHGDGNSSQLSCMPTQLPQAGQLQVLELTGVGFDLRVLADTPQLHELVMYDCLLLPDIPDDGDPEPELALLQAVGKLKQLRRLEVAAPICGCLKDLEPEVFSALTASSHLTYLSLEIIEALPWPLGAAKHIFPPGRQLQHLQELHITSDTVMNEVEDQHWCLGARDVLLLVTACPALTALTLANVVAPGAAFPLLQLPRSCQVLKVSGIAFDDSAAAVVARLTHLTELIWCQCPNFTDRGLEALTALTGLQNLQLKGDLGLSSYVAEVDPVIMQYSDLVLHLMSSQENMEHPDVFEQLWDICGRNPSIAARRRQQQQQQQRADGLRQLCSNTQQLSVQGRRGGGNA